MAISLADASSVALVIEGRTNRKPTTVNAMTTQKTAASAMIRCLGFTDTVVAPSTRKAAKSWCRRAHPPPISSRCKRLIVCQGSFRIARFSLRYVVDHLSRRLVVVFAGSLV